MDSNSVCALWSYSAKVVLGGLPRPTQSELESFVVNAPLQTPHGAAFNLFLAACQTHNAATALGLGVTANTLALEVWQDRKRKFLH